MSLTKKSGSVIVRENGQLYKVVSHYWPPGYWYDQLNVDVKYGPIPDSLLDEVEEDAEIDDDSEPYNLLFENNIKMKVQFKSISFVDNILKKGDTLHKITLSHLENDD